MHIEGDLHPFMANLLYFKDVIAAPRNRNQAGRPMSPRFESITGRYLQLELSGKPHRLYVEEAGQGIPLLCLHTAGADTRQYRGLMNDARVTANYRVIAFDMPWHGKSSPPAGWQDTSIGSPLPIMSRRSSMSPARSNSTGRWSWAVRSAAASCCTSRVSIQCVSAH